MFSTKHSKLDQNPNVYIYKQDDEHVSLHISYASFSIRQDIYHELSEFTMAAKLSIIVDKNVLQTR